MSSLRDVRVSYGDHAISDEDPSLGNALERVFEAQQNLVVRRVDLLVEQLNALGGNFVSAAVSALLGSLAALGGWFIAMAGVVDTLDDYFARSAVEIALGMIHVGAGVAILFHRRLRSRETTPA